MATPPQYRRFIVPGLWVGLLAVVVGVGLIPSSAPLPAQSGGQYGQSTLFGWPDDTGYIVIGALIGVIVAVALLYTLTRRRRRQPPVAAPGAVAGGAPPPGPGMPPSMGAAPAMGAAAGAGAVGGAAAAYTEAPEDASIPPSSGYAEGAAVAGAGAAAGKEQDIDSLLQELDKISGEILHRGTPPKKGEGSSGTESTQEGSGKSK